MNRFGKSFSGEASLTYGDGEFLIMKPGAFVTCAETGKTIPLDELKYWSAELQEAYIDCEAAVTRWRTVQGKP
jgi:hypothetical protein